MLRLQPLQLLLLSYEKLPIHFNRRVQLFFLSFGGQVPFINIHVEILREFMLSRLFLQCHCIHSPFLQPKPGLSSPRR